MPANHRPKYRTFVALILMAACAQATAAGVDLLIERARVVDGPGSPWFLSDVAISDGRIVAMAPNLDIETERTIDATGRILAPGFIDVHTHVE